MTHADIGSNVQLKNARDEKPDRTIVLIHPEPDSRELVKLTPRANLAIEQDDFAEDFVAYICQAADFFESDGFSVPEFHLAEKLGYTGFTAAQDNFIPEVKLGNRVTLNRKTKKKLAEWFKQNAEHTRSIWNILTDRLPANITRLLALCVTPVIF